MRLALALAVLVVGSGPGWAAGRPPAALMQRWAQANEDCRGGSGDDPDTMKACEYRNAIDHKMAAAGWCFGSKSMDWERCHH